MQSPLCCQKSNLIDGWGPKVDAALNPIILLLEFSIYLIQKQNNFFSDK